MSLRESVIEKALVKEARAGWHGGKFVSPGFDGVPDRLVLLPGGKCAFVELKAPGKKLRPLKEKRKHQLEALGFSVYVIDGLEQIGGVLHGIQTT